MFTSPLFSVYRYVVSLSVYKFSHTRKQWTAPPQERELISSGYKVFLDFPHEPDKHNWF